MRFSSELFLHDVVHFVGIGLELLKEQPRHPADVFKRHVERAAALNEAQALHVIVAVGAVTVVRPADGRKKSFVLIKTDGRGGHPGELGELFDSHAESRVG